MKAPDFNPRTEVKIWFLKVYFFKFNLYRYNEVTVPESALFAATAVVQSVVFSSAATEDDKKSGEEKLDAVTPAADAVGDGSTDQPAVFDFEVMPAPRAVSGCVVDEETKKPLAGMSVTLTPAGSNSHSLPGELDRLHGPYWSSSTECVLGAGLPGVVRLITWTILGVIN